MWYVAIFQRYDGRMDYLPFFVNGDMATAMVEWLHLKPGGCHLRVLAERDNFDWQITRPDENTCEMTAHARV